MLGCLAKALAILSTYTQKDSNLAVLFQMNALCIQLVEGCLINQRCGSEFHNISLHCSSTKKREKFQTAFYSSGICWLNYTATHCDVMAHCVICNEPLFFRHDPKQVNAYGPEHLVFSEECSNWPASVVSEMYEPKPAQVRSQV